LTFVLITGAEATKTLASKLAMLEAEAAVPVRFVRAQQLADLREQLAGPLPLGIFSQHVLASGRVLGPDFVKHLVMSYRAEQTAHTTFVEAMLAARGVSGTGLEWASDEQSEPAA
jgi:hypothetical protein